MRPAFVKKSTLLLLAAVFFLYGCAADLPMQTRRYVWPRLPDPPKIEWIKSYYGENDFPKSGFTTFMEALFGSPGELLFMKPIDIKSNGKGLVYVTDIVLPGIFVFDLEGKKKDFWAKSSDIDAGMGITPYYISLDDEGNVYVVGVGRKEIDVLAPTGKLIRRIDFTDKVASPAGIAVHSKSGRIYLLDGSEAKAAVFDLSGKYLFSFGKPGDQDGEFNRPVPIIINNKDEVIIGDTINCRIQIFDLDGKFLRKFGQRGDGASEFQIIKGVAVDSDDNIYVTDAKANQFKVFNSKGEFLIAIGTAYSVTKTMKEAPGGFLLPQGIHIDKNDSIFIADQANMRFQHFRYLKDGDTAGKAPAAPVGK
jgi:DNA-binding beta-propeller fold protein YncE